MLGWWTQIQGPCQIRHSRIWHWWLLHSLLLLSMCKFAMLLRTNQNNALCLRPVLFLTLYAYMSRLLLKKPVKSTYCCKTDNARMISYQAATLHSCTNHVWKVLLIRFCDERNTPVCLCSKLKRIEWEFISRTLVVSSTYVATRYMQPKLWTAVNEGERTIDISTMN